MTEVGISWFLLSCGVKLRLPLQWQRRPQGISPVASKETGLLSGCEGEVLISLMSLQRNRVCFTLGGWGAGRIS